MYTSLKRKSPVNTGNEYVSVQKDNTAQQKILSNDRYIKNNYHGAVQKPLQLIQKAPLIPYNCIKTSVIQRTVDEEIAKIHTLLEGNWIALKKDSKLLYRLLGSSKTGRSAYFGSNHEAINEFLRTTAESEDTRKLFRVKGQGEKHSINISDSTYKQNYYHFLNQEYKKENKEKRKNTTRRVVVNVETQSDTIAVCKVLIELIKENEDVREHLREFKAYLSGGTQTTAGDSVKHDKIVVYYQLKSLTDRTDTVGDAIVTTIHGAEAKFKNEMTPLYSQVRDTQGRNASGIYWAEEPKDHSQLKGSFTESRAMVIQEVIDQYKNLPAIQDFSIILMEKFEQHKINPQKPHRHIH